MATVRAHEDGTATLGTVYQTMFHAPGVARRVGALGDEIRFHGVLPDDVRELVILRYSSRAGFGYEWSHHQRPARLADLDPATVDAITAGEIPTSLRPEQQAALTAVDQVIAHRSIPVQVQRVLINSFGEAGAVELVVTCGLYAIMGYTVVAFDIATEPRLPPAPF